MSEAWEWEPEIRQFMKACVEATEQGLEPPRVQKPGLTAWMVVALIEKDTQALLEQRSSNAE